MRSPRQSDYHIYALRRSGHHAIMNWIIWSMPNLVLLRNDRIEQDNTVIKYGKVQVFKGSKIYTMPMAIRRLVWGSLPARIRIESFEDRESIDTTKSDHSIVIIRDFYNNMASRLKWERDFRNRFRVSDVQESETRSEMLHARELWKQYAQLAICPPPHLLTILYDRWLNDVEYRDRLSSKLGISGDQQALNSTAQYGPGSSFEGMSNTPDPVRLSNRFKAFAEDKLYIEIASDPEILALNAQLFGETHSNSWANSNLR